MGILFVWPDAAGVEQRDAHVPPSTAGATNNQMELEAVSEALRIALRGRTPFALDQFEKILILGDSQYVCQNLRSAMYEWPRNRWRTQRGTRVLNERDWKTLMKLMQRIYREHRLRVSIEWEPGKVSTHAKAVDKLAKRSSASASFGRARPTNVRRKRTSASVEPGSVRVEGQALRIRVIEARYLSRRETRYRYEVVEPGGPYHGKVDFAESTLLLGPGHTYHVRMNADQEHPRIEELIDEVVEDLTPYVEALRRLARPASATDVATEVTRATGTAIPPPVAKRRLDKLVERKEARKNASGRPHFYEPISADQSATVE